MAINTPSEKTASLAVVDFEALGNKDSAEIQKLVQASQTAGMFYLDLRGPRTKAIFEDVPIIFETGHEFFNLPQGSEEKTQCLREGMERGYGRYDPSLAFHRLTILLYHSYHVGKGFEYYEVRALWKAFVMNCY